MAVEIVFETHSISEDNENGIATGWHHGRLSDQGRLFARELGKRRRNDGIQIVFTSDLRRAVETAEIAFGDSSIPILHDWRLRECDYGEQNGASRDEIERTRLEHLDFPHPGGESWRQAVHRVKGFLDDVGVRWQSNRVLVIGHRATQFGFEHHLNRVPLERLLQAQFTWQAGWEYSRP